MSWTAENNLLKGCAQHRYLRTQDEKLELREDFVTFVEADTGTTGEALATKFLDALGDCGFEIQTMPGQGYDGAANMKGVNKGVQTSIKRVVPQTQYTHCRAHQLNLCIVHACRIPEVRNMMDIVQQISFSFNLCAKKRLAFQEHLETDATAQEALYSRTKLQSLCETRWASHAEVIII